jgi:hypothetical protein
MKAVTALAVLPDKSIVSLYAGQDASAARDALHKSGDAGEIEYGEVWKEGRVHYRHDFGPECTAKAAAAKAAAKSK